MAGPYQIITLPTDSSSLDGSASSDPDGTIGEWLWTKISGPASFYLVNNTSIKTEAKNLVAGNYQFELKVTDNGGLSARDTIKIIVNDPAQLNRPPVANAGPDQTIGLPANSVNLDGSTSTDPDNNIAAGAEKSKFDIYDITTNTWSVGVLPVSIYDASIISVNNVIYVTGSFVSGGLSDQVWKLEF